MVDYISSLQRGINAAQQAAKNRDEVGSVLENLNEQLKAAFEGKLEIGIFTKLNPLAAFIGFAGGQRKPESQFVGAKNPLAADQSPVELAGWKVDPSGYPIQLTIPEAEIYCENRTALEKGLQELLSQPDVGEKLYLLMARKPKPVVHED